MTKTLESFLKVWSKLRTKMIQTSKKKRKGSRSKSK